MRLIFQDRSWCPLSVFLLTHLSPKHSSHLWLNMFIFIFNISLGTQLCTVKMLFLHAQLQRIKTYTTSTTHIIVAVELPIAMLLKILLTKYHQDIAHMLGGILRVLQEVENRCSRSHCPALENQNPAQHFGRLSSWDCLQSPGACIQSDCSFDTTLHQP